MKIKYLARLLILVLMFMYFLLPKNTINATACSFPVNANATVASTCDLGAGTGTVDGVDVGTGTTNTGTITIDNGATLTVGNGNNQTLAYGSITNNGTIIIAKNVGAQLKKGPLWAPDADGDGYPTTASPTLVAQSSQPANYSRRNILITLATADCNDANPAITLASNWYTDADGDGYGTGAPTNACSALPGQVANNTDCLDSGTGASYVYQNQTVAKDVDADGYGTAALASTCVGLWNGYAYRGTDGVINWYPSRSGYADCFDYNPNVWQNLSCALSLGTPVQKNYTGGQQTYVVPAGVTKVQIEAYGSQAGLSGRGGAGGMGGKATGTITVTPGETLYVYAGGSAGYNGGGSSSCYGTLDGGIGGGASDVRQGGTGYINRVVVAGGGGGKGGGESITSYGIGGTGGEGGAVTGGNGGTGGCGTVCPGNYGVIGIGGTQSAGGGGGANYSGGSANSGSGNGTGGNATAYTVNHHVCGGGGGGGYYGGGAGGESWYSGGAGGGGGSSWVTASATVVSYVAGTRTGDGYVIITPYTTASTCSGASCPAGTCAGWYNGGYCWYNGASGQSCTTVCSTHGGVAVADAIYGPCNWYDPPDCSTCKHFYPAATCPQYMSNGPYYNNSTCYYHGWGYSDCAYTLVNANRQCACVN